MALHVCGERRPSIPFKPVWVRPLSRDWSMCCWFFFARLAPGPRLAVGRVVLPPLAPREGRWLTGPCRDGRRVWWARGVAASGTARGALADRPVSRWPPCLVGARRGRLHVRVRRLSSLPSMTSRTTTLLAGGVCDYFLALFLSRRGVTYVFIWCVFICV
jgi:hypothetical protein